MKLKDVKKSIFSYSFVIPTLILICLFMLYPIIYSFIFSFTNMNMGKPAYKFVGLRNYINLFTMDKTFINSLFVTLIFVFSLVTFNITVGMLMALALNIRHKLSGFVRALLIVPWALPGTIVAGIWRFIYIPKYGFISVFLNTINYPENINWLGPELAMFSIVFSEVWRMSPLIGLILLAGLATIPKELYEAASVDGANNWQMFWRITLPMLKPILSLAIIMRTLFAFQTIDVVFVLTKGGPGNATYLIPYYLYRLVFFNMRAGYGNSLAYVGSLIAIIVCLIYIFATRGREKVLK